MQSCIFWAPPLGDCYRDDVSGDRGIWALPEQIRSAFGKTTNSAGLGNTWLARTRQADTSGACCLHQLFHRLPFWRSTGQIVKVDCLSRVSYHAKSNM